VPFKRILCFGDSYTFGTTSRAIPGLATLSPIEGYVPKLARLLAAEFGKGTKLINSGLGGETTGAGLARLPGELRIHDPDLVLLHLGVVDVSTDKPRFTDARNNLVDMMHLILRSNVKVIIGTYPALDPDGFRGRVAAPHVSRLNTIIRQEANKQQVPVAGHERAFGRKPGLLGTDGLHPNDNGYEIIADTWFEVIKDIQPK
jgi:acyl-CoA thioesterase-1